MKVTNSKKAKKQTELQKILEKHKSEFSQLGNGKIKCLVTGHEFMPTEKNVVAHLSSKSYKKASQAKYDITEYEAVLLTHKDDENFLFCKLTSAKIPKKKTAIQKHVTGKRFKSRFEQFKAQLEEEEEEQGLIEEEEDDEEGDEIIEEEGDDEEQGDDEEDEEDEDEEENDQEIESEEEEEQKAQEQVPALIPADKNNSNSKNSTPNGVKKPQFKKTALSGAKDKKRQKNQKKQKKQNKQKRILKSRR